MEYKIITSNGVDTIRVNEDPSIYTLSTIMYSFEDHPNLSKVEIGYSRNTPQSFIPAVLLLLEEVDKMASKFNVSIELRICPCCQEHLKDLTTSKRWRSRWVVY